MNEVPIHIHILFSPHIRTKCPNVHTHLFSPLKRPYLRSMISVIFAWINWVFRTHSWILICFILCLRPYFSYYACFGLFGVFDFRFTYIEPSNGRKWWIWGQMDQGRLQKRPIKPKAEDPRQNPQTKKKHQNAEKMMNLRPNGSRKVAKEAHKAQGRRSKAKPAD